MPGRKKTRKTGPIGVSKSNVSATHGSPSESSRKRKKSSSGKPAGSRHSAGKVTTNTTTGSVKCDPRLGSKKPIPLLAEKSDVGKHQDKTVHFSPREELLAIENDDRLNDLLDRVESDEVLNDADAVYFETRMQRHAQLCSLLGIKMNDQDDPDTDDDVNLYK